MSNKILFVFEGQKSEEKLWKIFHSHYPLGSAYVVSVFANNIYDLSTIVQADPYLDIVEIIRSRSPENEVALDGIRRSDISEVYLFFDYDCHDKKSIGVDLCSLIETFSDEYEQGRIFISYPMLESHRHCKKFEATEFLLKAIPRIDVGSYKKIVHDEGHFSQFHKLSKSEMNWLSRLHLVKAVIIKNGIKEFDLSVINIELVEQVDIHRGQLNFYQGVDDTVAILGAFPCFYLYYFGEKFMNEIGCSSPNFLQFEPI